MIEASIETIRTILARVKDERDFRWLVAVLERHGAPTDVVDKATYFTMCVLHDGMLGEHVAKQGDGASQECREELYRWCLEHDTRYAIPVAKILRRSLAISELYELIDRVYAWTKINRRNQIGPGCLFPEISRISGVLTEHLIYMSELLKKYEMEVAPLPIPNTV